MQRQLHQPKRELIVDYVLGLLDSAESATLEQHAANCPDCRAAIQQERQIGRAVHGALTAYPNPTHARLMQLKPAVPPRQPTWQTWLIGVQRNVQHSVQRNLAVAMVVIVLFLGVGFQQMQGGWNAVASPIPTAYALTSTATTQPTATHTQIALAPQHATTTPEMTPVPQMHSQ